MCLGEIGVITKTWQEDGVPLALVHVRSTTETVCLLATPHAEAGTSVLVHMGFALEILDPERAEEAKRLRAEATSQQRRFGERPVPRR